MLMLTALCADASAENQSLSMEYVPRTSRGALFYVDVYCEKGISAGVFELSYDAAAAEYHDAYAENDDASAMGEADHGIVKIAFSHHSHASGKLFRVALKALKTGTTRFTLHVTQAVDGDLNYLTDIPDCELEIKLGKDDVVDSGQLTVTKDAGSSKTSDKSADNSESAEKKKSAGGEKSSASGMDDNSSDSEIIPDQNGVDYDFSGENNKVYFMLGGAAAIFAGLLVTAGFILGKKRRKKPAPDSEMLTEESEDIEPDQQE